MIRFIKKTRLSIIFLVVVILLIFLNYFGIFSFAENIFIKIFSPLQSEIYSLGTKINNFYSGKPVGDNLIEKNQELEEQISQLLIENAQLKIILEESKQIDEQYNFLQREGLQGITARVIGKNPEPNLNSIILNKGSNDGIKVDMPLIISEGIMIGKIFKVKAGSSEAILLNDSLSRVAALVQNESNSKGAVVGEHGLSLKMELIPQNEKVETGDLVVTSGLESTIPKGLVIGKVIETFSEPNSFFQVARIQPLTRLDNLTIVSILINRNGN